MTEVPIIYDRDLRHERVNVINFPTMIITNLLLDFFAADDKNIRKKYFSKMQLFMNTLNNIMIL